MFKCLNQSLHSNYQGTGYDRSVTDGHNKLPYEIIYTLNVTDGHIKSPSETIYTLNVTDGHNKSPSEIIYTLNVTDGHIKSPSEIIYTLNPRSDTANYRLGLLLSHITIPSLILFPHGRVGNKL